MPNNLSDYLEGKLIGHVMKGSAYAQPTHVYVGLSTANPGESGSGLAEPVGNGYARVNADALWAFSGNQATSNAACTFPVATGAGWGTVTHLAVFDASAAGNMLWYGPVQSPQIVSAGVTPYFPSGGLVFAFDNVYLSNYLAAALIRHVFKGTAFTQPANLYEFVSTANPLADASGLAEPSGNGYARVNVNTKFTLAGSLATQNADITWPQATPGGWGALSYHGLFDASSAGNMLWHGPLSAPVTINALGTFYLPSGQLVYAFD